MFAKLQDKGLEFLSNIIAEKTEEGLHLDAKRLKHDGDPLAPDDRNNLAKSLSGFANAEGGDRPLGASKRASKARAFQTC